MSKTTILVAGIIAAGAAWYFMTPSAESVDASDSGDYFELGLGDYELFDFDDTVDSIYTGIADTGDWITETYQSAGDWLSEAWDWVVE